MALPMMSTPTYNMVVPSTGETVRFRPFLVKEEKALLIAQQSEDVGVMVESLRNVIGSCIQDKIDVDKLATFDLEYMFTQIRAKSVGETIDLLFSCDQESCQGDPKATVKMSIDLTTIQVEKNPDHTNKFQLFGDVGIVMKYPSVKVISMLQGDKADNLDNIFDVIVESIDYIYQGDEIYYGKEQTKAELKQFVENLSSEQFLKVQSFFTTMPKIKKEVEYDCPVCRTHHKRTLEGMQSFF